MRIRVGNQTALSAGSPLQPFSFAVAQGFDAFEWFPDRNETGAGWTEDDLDREQRASIRETAVARDIRLSVHAPWWANPLNPEAIGVFEKSLAFAQDIGAFLFNLHFYHELGAAAFGRALARLLERLASTQIKLSIENTPLTGPDECNALFEALARSGLAERERLGLCFDLGHANLCQATHNDYLKFLDRLNPEIPILHVHIHENYGDRDSHLPLFTGPAGRDPSGIEELLRRLAERGFSGCFILEQWPDPPTLLAEARNRLLEMIGTVFPGEGVVFSRPEEFQIPIPGQFLGSSSTPPSLASTQKFIQVLVEADRENRSWRQKLAWIRDALNSSGIASDLERLACLAIYLRFIGTGQVPCTEDGRHFRPSHHALLAHEIGERLAAITTSQNLHIVRAILPWLPSAASEFMRSEPLTLIRDIAHRNDIPKELKGEIKQTLQNKLHRCAGPEDLVTSAAILARITASEGSYAPAFVAQFQHFHEQLEEFFNARSLDQQLEALAGEAKDPEAALIRTFLDARADGQDGLQPIRALRRLSELRERFYDRLKESCGSLRQQLQLADLRLEEYGFVLLSRLINHFERLLSAPEDARESTPSSQVAKRRNPETPASGMHRHDIEALERDPGQGVLVWPLLLECLRLTVANLRCSGFDAAECRPVEAELEAWRQGFDPADEQPALRLKATLERARRLADEYRDTILRVFPPCAVGLGRALGVAEASVLIYAESVIRSHLIFQHAKLISLYLKALGQFFGWSPWEVIVPGDGAGVLVGVPSLERLPPAEKPTIALVDRLEGDEELPGTVSGVIVSHETPYLSHFAVRAREHGVVFVACEDAEAFSAVRPLAGRRVVLKASPGKVDIRPAGGEGLNSALSRHPDAGQTRSNAPRIELLKGAGVLALDRATAANAGGKAYGVRVLEELADRDGANFQTVRSLVIPFGAMEASLHCRPSVEREYHRCRDLLHRLPPEDCSETLERLRSLVRGLAVPEAVVSQVMAQFGDDARLMVRSSASCEDLAQTAGAGLYVSVANVSAEGLPDAVREVWASLWSPQAAASRRDAGLPHDRVFMAVLIQELVAPDLSFIMHTVNPVTGNRAELLVELVVGLGQTLASADHPGSPYRLVGNKLTGETRLLAFANFSQALFPRGHQGTVVERLDYSRIRFSCDASFRQALGERLTAMGRFVEQSLATPQDIEGVIAGGAVYVVQSRPQQGLLPK